MLHDMVPTSERTASLVSDITPASRVLAIGSSQRNESVQRVDSVTQGNTAASEELSAAATELSSQAEHLAEVISFFQVDDDSAADDPDPVEAETDAEPEDDQKDEALLIDLDIEDDEEKIDFKAAS